MGTYAGSWQPFTKLRKYAPYNRYISANNASFLLKWHFAADGAGVSRSHEAQRTAIRLVALVGRHYLQPLPPE
jgi:hypothetical protein